MSDSSNPCSIVPVKPVDPATCDVLRRVDQVAAVIGFRYFVAGAMARDLVLVNAFGLPAGRATRDIDFGIAVENWDQFQRLKVSLIETKRFDAAPKDTHRLYWKAPDSEAAIPIDLIPNKMIARPPDLGFVMNVAGFDEALDSAIHLRIEDDLVIPVAKDAADLLRLLTYYADAGNLDRLYEHELDLLEAVEFDLELAGAQLLGSDVVRICQTETRRQISALLTSARLLDQLTIQMDRTELTGGPQEERTARLLRRFCQGFRSA